MSGVRSTFHCPKRGCGWTLDIDETVGVGEPRLVFIERALEYHVAQHPAWYWIMRWRVRRRRKATA